jgi:hypothetical protein
MKGRVSVETVMHETMEELWEMVFSVAPRRGCIWRIGIELGQSVIWRLPEPSDSTMWSWVPWDSKPKFTVLTRTRSNLAGRQAKSFESRVEAELPEVEKVPWRRRGSLRNPYCCKPLASPSLVVRETPACEATSPGSVEWGVLPGDNQWRHSRLRRITSCCSEFQNMWIGDSTIVLGASSFKSQIHPITNPNPVYTHPYHVTILTNILQYSTDNSVLITCSDMPQIF